MLKKIIGTVGTRLITAIINFCIVIAAAKYLGAEQYGNISLLLVNIAFSILIHNFIGGGALVYLASRENNTKLIVPSYIWAIIVAIGFTVLLVFIHKIPEELKYHFLALAIVISFNGINNNILLGHEKIKEVNILSIIQVSTFFISFITFVFILNNKTILSYIISLYISHTLTFFTSIFFLKKLNTSFSFSSGLLSIKTTLRIFNFGKYIQLANIAQFFNYRLNYYIIDFFLGKAALGIYTAGNQISEGMWLISKSISMVQYSRISNTKDYDYAKSMTVRMIKFSFIITLLIILLALSIPSQVYVTIFGDDYAIIKMIIMSLAIGILSIALSTLFSSFFSGIGKPHHNTISSVIGLVVTASLGFTLIPRFGIIAAGLVASAAYFSSVVYQVIVFAKISNSKIKEFIPNKFDIQYFKTEVYQLFK